MAKNATQSNEQLIIYDEVLAGKDSALRIFVEIPKVESNARRYLQALKNARGIPFDLDAINPLDHMYAYVLDKYPEFVGKPELSREKVKHFYQQLEGGAYRDAMMLAVTAHPENKFDFNPTPYDDDSSFLEDDELPGLVSPPKVKPNLADPTERRLKQLYDWLQANPEHLMKLNGAFELAVIKVNELAVKPKTDENGFQPKPTN